MKSPVTVKLRKLADAELAYRRLRDDVFALSSVNPATVASLASMRRVLVQSVLSDRFVGSYIGGSLVDDDSVIYTPISTLADLHTLVRSNLKGKFKLTADIDATSACLSGGDYYNAGEGWVPIGDLDEGEGGSADSGFQGTFDGAGYTITGIKCDRPSEDYQALFGFIGTGGTVKNLEVAATILSGRSQMGGLCGGNAGLVYNCHVTGASEVSGNNTNLDYSGNIGGFVGDNDGTIRLCSAAGTVTGLRDVGGVSGDNDGILQNCWFTGDVICSVVADAGLISGDNKGFIEDVPMADIPVIKGNIYGCFGVGTVQSIDIAAIGAPPPTGNIALGVGDNRGGKISSSYAVGTVTGKNPDVAGFVGNNELGDNSLGETVDSIISNCYCEGTITPEGLLPAEGAVGGFVGKNKGGQIYNSYSASTVGGTAGVEREHVEGFCGNNSNDSLVGTISNCFFDSTLYSSGDGDEDGLSTGKSTAQLEHRATFTGWDFGTIWDINEGSEYPTLPDMPEVSDDGDGDGDGGGDVEGDGTPVEVFPIQIIGNNPLTGDVRPKVLPGHVIFAGICEDGVVRTPVIVEDMNFPVSRDDIADGAVGKDQLGDVSGNEILGQALGWDDTENIDVQVNDTNIHVNSSNQLAVVDDSIGRSKLGNDNGDGILGDGLSWGFGNVIEVDMSEISVSGSDLTDMVDEITIGFDNPKAYVAGRTYETDEKVEYSGDNYVSLQDANTGNTPDDFESLWWLSIAGQKVLKIEEDVPGDGLQWSANGKIEVNNGVGLDINGGTGALDVDLSEIPIAEARIFELTYNKASDGDLDSELSGVGAAGAVTGASGQNENGIYGQTFDPDAKQAIVWSGIVPNDYKAGTDIVIKARWCLSQDGDVGATVWRSIVVSNEVERGDATVIGSVTVGTAVDNAVPAGEPQRTMHTLTLLTAASLESRDLISIALMRDATHANDTCTKDIFVLDKIFAEYTADKI